MGGADGRSTEINANIQSPDIVRPHAPFPTWATLRTPWKRAPEPQVPGQLVCLSDPYYCEPWSPHQESGIIAHWTERTKWDSEGPQETLKPQKHFPRQPLQMLQIALLFQFQVQKAFCSPQSNKFKDNVGQILLRQILL